MAIVTMQKVAILAHNAAKENLIEALHHEGVVQISTAKTPVTIDHTEVNFRKAEVQFAISVLKSNAAKETLAVTGKPASEKEIIHTAQTTDVRGIIDELHSLEEIDTEAERSIKENLHLIEMLTPWHDLSCNLHESPETLTTVRMLGMLPKVKYQELQLKIAHELPRTEMQIISQDKGMAFVATHVWKEDSEAFEHAAVTYGWTNVQLPSLDGTPSALLEKAQMEVKEFESIRRKNAQKRQQLSVELPQLVKVAKYIAWLDEKQHAREAMSGTDSTVTLLGWVPKKKIADLEQMLQKVAPASAILKVKPDDGEETPVLIQNNKLITPFESVTKLYGLPLSSEMDPTSSLSPFFILYFALCLTDAGYGAVIALIFGSVLFKTRKTIEEAPLLWLLFFGGVMTFFVSILFGGWFGFAPEQAPAFLTKETIDGEILFKGQIWNLSTQSGIEFLQNLSLVLGLTHLSFGMFLAGMHKWVHGKKMEALWMDFTNHMLIGAGILYAVHSSQLTLYVLYAALALFIWGKGYGSKWFVRPLMGALGLINFAISLLSNSLSYLRLLALGLVTGAIAMAVNQVAVEMGKLFPIWIAVPVVILIFTMGHLVSIALNTLGSFIHSGRLQFIEFFSQFFEGGGQAFSPFRRSSS